MHTGDAILRLICRAQPPVVLPCSPADIAALQQPDGSFWGDEWGETDTRFSYCALSALWLLDRLEAVDVPAAAAYVAACKNFDGGFGCTPGVCATCCRERGGGRCCMCLCVGAPCCAATRGRPSLQGARHPRCEELAVGLSSGRPLTCSPLARPSAGLPRQAPCLPPRPALLQATSRTRGRCSRAWRRWTLRGGSTSLMGTCCAGGERCLDQKQGWWLLKPACVGRRVLVG